MNVITQIKKMITPIIYAVIGVIFLFSLVAVNAGEGQKNGEESPSVEVEEMIGPIVYFTPRNDPKVISIGHDLSNTDYSFIIDEDTRVEHKDSLKDIKVGDMIKVEYLRITTKNNRGRKSEELRARVISFVRAAKKEEPRKAESESDSGAETEMLVSEEHEE